MIAKPAEDPEEASLTLVISKTSEADRCQKVIQPSNCNLGKCQADCSFQYRDYRGIGKCIGGSNATFQCVCFYDCGAPSSLV
ncbi:putative defensin-like protein 165 [Glycine max]|nr:putative defensin-like protein 165 [Glycine max]